MPLHSDAEATLRSFQEAGLPALDALPPTEARSVFGEAFRTPPEAQEPVGRVQELRIPGPAGEIPLRLYAPHADPSPPVLLHFHGGGWVICDLDTHDGVCRSLANAAGCAVVSVDYRLAPEHPYPAALEDCCAALDHVHRNAAELRLDASRLGVIGDSAGGNLAAAVALKARDAGGPALRVQILTYPALDPDCAHPSMGENAEGYFLTQSAMRWFWGHYMGSGADPRDPYLAPLYAPDLSGLPPALVVTAEYDPLRDEGEAYARRLEQAGTEVELCRFDGVFHGFALMGDTIASGRDALRLEAGFAKQHLGG
jgi:acetyl esterase